MRASEKGYSEIVTMLIEMGININARQGKGWTALMYALGAAQEETAKILINAGTDFDTPDEDLVSGCRIKL